MKGEDDFDSIIHTWHTRRSSLTDERTGARRERVGSAELAVVDRGERRPGRVHPRVAAAPTALRGASEDAGFRARPDPR